jgi:hypothetical protein
MNFVGSTLLELLEVALPARYGGSATDYQFVESERDGLTQVRLVIAPRVGPLDDARVVAFALDYLAQHTRGGHLQAGVWRSGGTLRVERAEPYLTRGAKVQALHVEQAAATDTGTNQGGKGHG